MLVYKRGDDPQFTSTYWSQNVHTYGVVRIGDPLGQVCRPDNKEDYTTTPPTMRLTQPTMSGDLLANHGDSLTVFGLS